MELALISFDGIDPRVIYERRDDLPNIDSILSRSVHGKWRTPGHTIPSFIATLTGRTYNEKNFHWDDGKGDYQRHRQTEFNFLWDICDSSMTILNNPVVYPPEHIDDVMICGFLTPDSLTETNLALPKEIQEYLNDVDYVHDIPADDTYEELGGDGMLDFLNNVMLDRVNVSEYLINEYNSDLFYGVWTSPDRWFHQCHLHQEDYLPMYDMVDDTVGEIMDILQDDIPKVYFSDHGFAHQPGDDGVHKGHMYEGWYCIDNPELPSYRDDSASIFDLFPTVVNYLEGEPPKNSNGRILFHESGQDQEIEDRLRGLGYLE